MQITLSFVGISVFAASMGMAWYSWRGGSPAPMIFFYFSWLFIPFFFTLISGFGLLYRKRWVGWMNLAIGLATIYFILALFGVQWQNTYLQVATTLLVLLAIGKWLWRRP